MVPVPREFRRWGVTGAFFAALFTLWMYFFPSLIPTHFAWDVEPRLAQVFIGAGYVFRTFFFLQFIFVRDWRLLRWSFWGNLAFTGTLMLATLWHADEFNWRFLVAHLWVLLYTFEPVTMIFMIPRSQEARTAHTTGGGPIGPWFRRFLIFETGLLALVGGLLIVNPEWLNLRWPWDLNPLDARMVAAWFTGWAVWTGAIVLAADWDEVRTAARLNILLAATLTISALVFRNELDFSLPTSWAYLVGGGVLTLAMALGYWNQERHRPG